MALGSTQSLTEMSKGKIGRCVQLTTLPPSWADCHEIWELQPPGALRACPVLYRDCFTFTLLVRVLSACGRFTFIKIILTKIQKDNQNLNNIPKTSCVILFPDSPADNRVCDRIWEDICAKNTARSNDIKQPTPNRSINVRNIGSIREKGRTEVWYTHFCFWTELQRILFLQYEVNRRSS